MKKSLFRHLCTGFFAMGIVLAGVLAFCPSQAAAKTIQLKFAHFLSANHIQHTESFEPFCRKVEELSGGKVHIKLYPGGALGNPKQLPDHVKIGITDMAFIIPPYNTGRFPRISAMDLPFLCQSSTHATQMIYDLYDPYFKEDFKDYKVLWLYASPSGHFMSVDKPIPTMASLAGLKMRTPTAYMSKVLDAVEANPIGLPISELAISLQKKIIDGMVTTSAAIDDFQLFNLVGHITLSHIYVTPMAVVMNKATYDRLPADVKKAIDQASGMQWGLHAAGVYDKQDEDTVAEIKKRGKIEIIQMSPVEIDRIKAVAKPLEEEWIAEAEKKGLPGKAIIDAVHAASKKYSPHSDQ